MCNNEHLTLYWFGGLLTQNTTRDGDRIERSFSSREFNFRVFWLLAVTEIWRKLPTHNKVCSAAQCSSLQAGLRGSQVLSNIEILKSYIWGVGGDICRSIFITWWQLIITYSIIIIDYFLYQMESITETKFISFFPVKALRRLPVFLDCSSSPGWSLTNWLALRPATRLAVSIYIYSLKSSRVFRPAQHSPGNPRNTQENMWRDQPTNLVGPE